MQRSCEIFDWAETKWDFYYWTPTRTLSSSWPYCKIGATIELPSEWSFSVGGQFQNHPEFRICVPGKCCSSAVVECLISRLKCHLPSLTTNSRFNWIANEIKQFLLIFIPSIFFGHFPMNGSLSKKSRGFFPKWFWHSPFSKPKFDCAARLRGSKTVKIWVLVYLSKDRTNVGANYKVVQWLNSFCLPWFLTVRIGIPVFLY